MVEKKKPEALPEDPEEPENPDPAHEPDPVRRRKPAPEEPDEPEEPEPDDEDDEEREKELVERERKVREDEERVKAVLKELEEQAAKVKKEAPPPSPPLIQPPPAPPPATHRGVPDRYKGIPAEDKVDIPPGSPLALDVEAMLARGQRPSEVLEDLGIPSNRFTHDQIRKYAIRTLGQRAQGGSTDLKELADQIDTWRKLGIVYNRDDLDKAIDRALERAGGPAGSTGDVALDGLDGESRANVIMAREVRAIGSEVVDAFRDITGHPKLGRSVSDELRQNRERTLRTQSVKELPPPGTRSPIPLMPGGPAGAPAPQAPAPPTGAQPKAALPIDEEHPEFYPALDRIVELAPRIHELRQQHGALPAAQVMENVQRDASIAAIAAWALSSKTRPGHEWQEDTCIRCRAKKTQDNIGRVCEKGQSQQDMLRRLYGLQVKDLIELVAQYQQSIEFTSPLDAIGGMSLRAFFMEKRWAPGDRMDLGGATIYQVVLQTDEGLTWLGTFLGKLKEEIDKTPAKNVPAVDAGTEATRGQRQRTEGPVGPTGPPPSGHPNAQWYPQESFEQTPNGGIVVRRAYGDPPEQAESSGDTG